MLSKGFALSTVWDIVHCNTVFTASQKLVSGKPHHFGLSGLSLRCPSYAAMKLNVEAGARSSADLRKLVALQVLQFTNGISIKSPQGGR